MTRVDDRKQRMEMGNAGGIRPLLRTIRGLLVRTRESKENGQSHSIRQDEGAHRNLDGTLRLGAGLYRIGECIPAGLYELLEVYGHGCVRKFYDESLQNHNYSHYVSAALAVPNGVFCSEGEYLRIDRGVALKLRCVIPARRAPFEP